MRKLLKISFSMGMAVCWAMTGSPAHAAYIDALNAIAGADKISYWDLNEASGSTTAADAWTTGFDGNNTGTYSGTGITVGAAGPRPEDGFLGFSASNNATNFATGSNTRVLKMLNTSAFNSLTSLTMLMWFNIPTAQNTSTEQFYFGGISDANSAASNRYAFMVLGNRNPRAFIRLQNGAVEVGASGGALTDPADIFRDDEWHMLAMTMADGVGVDAGRKVVSLYVDGVAQSTGFSIAGAAGLDLADRHTVGTSPAVPVLTFGNDLGIASSPFRRYIGRMDEIAFIGRSLSAEEIGRLYNAAVVPEPGSIVLLSIGALAGLFGMRKRLAK